MPLSEIGYITVGLNAKIRLNTPEGSRFRPINGKVVLSADRTSTKNEEEDFYLVKIETDETSFSKQDERFKLYSGVPVIVESLQEKEVLLIIFLHHLNQVYHLHYRKINYKLILFIESNL